MVLRTARTVASLLIAALLAASLGTATAHAISVDVLFLRELRQHGIGYGDPNATAKMGHGICRQFEEGGSYEQVRAAAQTLPGGIQLGPDDAAVVVKAATDTMCSEFSDRIPD